MADTPSTCFTVEQEARIQAIALEEGKRDLKRATSAKAGQFFGLFPTINITEIRALADRAIPKHFPKKFPDGPASHE